MNEIKKCKFPTCDKERAPKKMFCLEHEETVMHDVPDGIVKGAKVLGTLGTVGVAIIGAVDTIATAVNKNKDS